jgi:translation initiation factor 1
MAADRESRSKSGPPGGSKLVYSTDGGRVDACEGCGRPRAGCTCPPPAEVPPAEQSARVAVEKRPGGKVVTVVSGLAPGPALEKLGKDLRTKLGTGGTVKDGAIEVQGDHRPRVSDVLRSLGYRVK